MWAWHAAAESLADPYHPEPIEHPAVHCTRATNALGRMDRRVEKGFHAKESAQKNREPPRHDAGLRPLLNNFHARAHGGWKRSLGP